MAPAEIAERVKELFPQAASGFTAQDGDACLEVEAWAVAQVATFLKEEPELAFDSLMCLSGVDYGQKLGVVYHLFSFKHRHKMALKIKVDKEAPSLSTVEGIWKGAGFFEREAFDLFGLVFTGHSDLRRILLPDDWEGHPLRKDYQVPKSYHGIKI